MSTYKRDFRDSLKNFKNLVWPELRKFIDGQLIVIEGSKRKEHLKLDRKYGIDYSIKMSDDREILISSRIQPDDGSAKFPYNTFTVRKTRTRSHAKTEYKKLVENRKNSLPYPELAVHAYVTKKRGGKLISFGVAYTDKILDFIASGRAGEEDTDNADFYVVPFRTVAHYLWPKQKTLLKPTTINLDNYSIIPTILARPGDIYYWSSPEGNIAEQITDIDNNLVCIGPMRWVYLNSPYPNIPPPTIYREKE